MSKSITASLTTKQAETLAGKYASARKTCRTVMAANWANKDVTESYRKLVMDLTGQDESKVR